MKSAKNYFLELIRFLLPVAILACGVIGFAAISNQRQRPQRIERSELVPLVDVVTVEVHSDGLDLLLDGTVVPHREICISAEVGGRITRKAPECRAGRFVTAGTLLVEIDPREYQLQVDRLTEEVAQGDAMLQELDVDIENTDALIELANEETLLRQRELRRVLSLQQQNAASESSVDDTKRMELMARNSSATLKNQVRKLEASRARLRSARDLAQTKLEEAKLSLEKSQVRAPIDGVIVTEGVEENNFVQPGATLFAIDDTSAAEVRCSLRMEELEWVLRQNQTAAAAKVPVPGHQQDYELPATPVTVGYRTRGGEYCWTGTLARFEGIGLDEKTRTVPCRILVPNPREVSCHTSTEMTGGPRALVRGMYVHVTLHTQPDLTLLRIPEQAVQPGNNVYCVREGKLRIIPLRDISLADGHVLTPPSEGGLQAGDQVIITPLTAPVEGMSVRVEASASEAEKVAGP